MTSETAIVVQKELDCRIDISMYVGYTPSHDDRHYLRYDCHYSRDDRSSSQNCSSANYSPPVKDNIPKCYCYHIDIDFSNEQHA